MRITNNMMITNMMRNLNRNMQRLDQRQMQVATGKRIHKPSDDPIAISRSLKIRADISELEQHRKNVEDAVSWLETTEIAIKNMADAMQRVRELTVQASNGVLTSEETFKIQNEIKELKGQIIGLSNSTYAGKYIFSGKNSDRPLLDSQGNYIVYPYNIKNPNLVDHRMKFEVGLSELIDINILGVEVLENIGRPSSLTLEFPKQDGIDKAITLKLEDMEIKIIKDPNEDAQYIATYRFTDKDGNVIEEGNINLAAYDEDGVVIPWDEYEGDVKEAVAKSISSFMKDFITDENKVDIDHPLRNYMFDAVDLKSNVLGSDGDWNIVATPQKAGLINLLESIERNMIDGKNEQLSKQLGDIDVFLNRLLNSRSEVGAKVNRMELVHNRILDDKINFRTLQSQLEDADMGETLMELMNEENVYRASLSVGARIIQPTLLDFLR